MKLICLLILIGLSVVCNGQADQFFQVWMATAQYRVENIALGELDDNFEILMPLLDDGSVDSLVLTQLITADSIEKANKVKKPAPIEIDTNYYPLYCLLDLRKDGSAIYKEQGNEEIIVPWSTFGPTELQLGFETPLIARLDSIGYLSIVLYEDDTFQRKNLFEPISKTELDIPVSRIESILKKYSWEFASVKNTTSSELTFENDSLTLSIYRTDTDTYHSSAKWAIEQFQSHYFISINQSFYPHLLHLTGFKDGDTPIITVDQFALEGFPFETKYPKNTSYTLTANKLPSADVLSKRTKRLVGKWRSIDNPFPANEFYGSTEVKKTFLIYTLEKDGTALINYGGVIHDGIDSYKINKSEQVSWVVSKNGNILLFENAQNSGLLASFSFINDDTIEIRKAMNSLEGHHVGNMTFKMKRTKK